MKLSREFRAGGYVPSVVLLPLVILVSLGRPVTASGAEGGAADPAAATPALEPGPAAEADLGSLLREAQQNNAAIRAAEARLEASRRIPSQVQAPPDPVASVGYTNEGASGFTLGDEIMARVSLSWTQEVPYPGKLRLAGEAADLEAERMAKELERVRLEVIAAVKDAYAQIYSLDRTTTLLEETRATLQVLAQAARRRYEVGEGIQESVLKAQTEILRVEAEMTRIDQERRAAEVQLNAAAGRTADVPVGRAAHLPSADIAEDPETLSDLALAGSPEIAGLEVSVRRAEAGVKLARLNLKPDFSWTAAYDYRGGLDPMISGTFGVRLPVRRERKQAQAALQAESELGAARQDLADAQVRLRASVRDLVARARRAHRLARLFAEGIVPQARMTLESARASYGVGRVALLDVLTDLSTLLEACIDQVSEEAERFRALAALEPLVGRELIEVAEAGAQAAAEAGAGDGSVPAADPPEGMEEEKDGNDGSR